MLIAGSDCLVLLWHAVLSSILELILSAMKNFFGIPPSPQNALDLFQGSWSSRMPPGEGRDGLVAGESYLYGDLRLEWCFRHTGSLQGQRALEIGPLEASHTYMLEKAGVLSVDAVEANGGAYLRCLIVKEILGLSRSRFHLGDALKFLDASSTHYDFGLACGVLYHQVEPLRFLRLLLEHCQQVLIWTVLFNSDWVERHPEWSHKFGEEVDASEGEFHCKLRRYRYKDALAWSGFCGGGEDFALWFTRADLLRAIAHLGFEVVAVQDEEHSYSPAITVFARKAV